MTFIRFKKGYRAAEYAWWTCLDHL